MKKYIPDWLLGTKKIVSNKITLFVGDTGEYLANIAKQHDKNAKLITDINYKRIRAGTYYTSIGDVVTDEKFEIVLKKADIIIYSPPDVWSTEQTKLGTIHWLTVMRAFEDKTLINADHLELSLLNQFLALSDVRKTDSAQLWIAGCSITHGIGVEPSQRYGQLISNQLNLPVSFLTQEGSSISWSADQLLRSDLRPGDTVVWGLTSMGRITWFRDNKHLYHITISLYAVWPEIDKMVKISRVWEQDRAYDAITKIYQVINFCAKMGVKLYLAGILVDITKFSLKFDNYIPFYNGVKEDEENQFLDIGTDRDRHPGPLTHQWYAEKILEKIQQDSVIIL